MNRFLLAGILFVLWSCKNENNENNKGVSKPTIIDQLNWLSGTWMDKSPEGVLYESWKRAGDSTIEGSAFIIKGKDTVFSEIMKITQVDTSVFYVVKPGKDLPVSFKMITLKPNEVIFEDQYHDFPKTIHYKLKADSTLYALVEGTENRKPQRLEFNMKKVKY